MWPFENILPDVYFLPIKSYKDENVSLPSGKTSKDIRQTLIFFTGFQPNDWIWPHTMQPGYWSVLHKEAQPPHLAQSLTPLLISVCLDRFHPLLSFLWHPVLIYIPQAYFNWSNQSDQPTGFTFVL